MSHRKNLFVGLGVVLLTVLGSVSIAEAQGYPPPYYPPPPPPPAHGVYRSGLVFGFSGGVGAIHVDGCGNACGAAGVLEGHIGGMISPRAAVMLEIWGADHPWSANGNSFETINTFFTGALQYWVNDIVWIKGGLGVAEIRQDINDYGGYSYTSNSSTGFALFGAAGVEVLQSYNFALDIQLRIGNGFYSDSVGSFSAQNYALMVGFNWY